MAHVQVILRDDIDKLGKTGELVRVRPGYARNYLLPRGLAVVATEGNVRRIEHEKREALARLEKRRATAAKQAGAMAGVTLTIKKQAGEEGKLFGSVTAVEVASALEALGHKIDRRKIHMPDAAIKHVGSYELSAKLEGGVLASFKLEVVAAES